MTAEICTTYVLKRIRPLQSLLSALRLEIARKSTKKYTLSPFGWMVTAFQERRLCDRSSATFWDGKTSIRHILLSISGCSMLQVNLITLGLKRMSDVKTEINKLGKRSSIRSTRAETALSFLSFMRLNSVKERNQPEDIIANSWKKVTLKTRSHIASSWALRLVKARSLQPKNCFRMIGRTNTEVKTACESVTLRREISKKEWIKRTKKLQSLMKKTKLITLFCQIDSLTLSLSTIFRGLQSCT